MQICFAEKEQPKWVSSAVCFVYLMPPFSDVHMYFENKLRIYFPGLNRFFFLRSFGAFALAKFIHKRTRKKKAA